MQERLQKILSSRGICSRRKAEEYVTRGLVKVNGTMATLGQKADPEQDRIEVDGKVLSERQEMLYYLLNKPVGVVTTNATRTNQKTVKDLLPKALQGKIYPVGRLDKETSGLLLLTNDGVLAYRLTHPKFDHEKEYEVRVAHPVTDGQLHKLSHGMTISGEKTKPAKVERLGSSSFTITLTEGRNRQIRRMCQKVGSPVVELKRVRIMTLRDPALKSGQIRELTASERATLLASVALQ
ncbi:MAG: pseudouridine synthase [Candidatus Peribacteraceae bacterium]|nr:pseudouridine synthase [Candidatus Peribacteraceae bacterium]